MSIREQSGRREGDIYGQCRHTHLLRAPGFEPTPGIQVGVAVHYSATTIAYERAHLHPPQIIC